MYVAHLDIKLRFVDLQKPYIRVTEFGLLLVLAATAALPTIDANSTTKIAR
jgi:hypothetical protein